MLLSFLYKALYKHLIIYYILLIAIQMFKKYLVMDQDYHVNELKLLMIF